MARKREGIAPRLKSLALRNRKLLLPVIDLVKAMRNRRIERQLQLRYPNVEMVHLDMEMFRKDGAASELGQDVFVLERLAPKGFRGVFLDIGCNHASLGNNSLALERAGWTGYAFDPQSAFAGEWSTQRKTPFIQAAISNSIGEEDFVEFDRVHGWEHVLSGFLAHADPAQLRARPHRVIKVPTGPVSHFIDHPELVDLALIDVEGAEMLVLDGLSGTQPKWMIIENNRRPGGDDALRQRLIKQGYSYIARIGHTDDVFTRVDHSQG